jgi:hypothetical protein
MRSFSDERGLDKSYKRACLEALDHAMIQAHAGESSSTLISIRTAF